MTNVLIIRTSVATIYARRFLTRKKAPRIQFSKHAIGHNTELAGLK